MAKRGTLKIIVSIVSLTALLSCGGVYSSWLYAEKDTIGTEQEASLSIRSFEYKPEEVLPDEEEIGASHIELVNGLVGSSGLNGGTFSYLNLQILYRKTFSLDTIGSMGIDQATRFEELFGASSKNLAFLIWFVSDTEYYIFTLDKSLLGDGYAVGKTLAPIYKTIVKKENGTWVTKTSTKGYATAAYYEESNGNGTKSKIPSFDPETWVAGSLT